MPTTTPTEATIATGSAKAQVIAHSVYEGGPELITVQATGRRFILAELNTHRVLSKNSASSRAIPFPKQVRRILDDLALPEVWAAEQKGMQGGDEIRDPKGAAAVWQEASEYAIDAAQELANMGVHKSIVNRLLEPFMWHTVVMTGTAWQNFFRQRVSPLAQPEIRVMAEEIQTAVQNSQPRVLGMGQWHLPYVWGHLDLDENGELHDYNDIDAINGIGAVRGDLSRFEALARVSAARCARVSYLTQDGKRDLAEDLKLYERLVTARPRHWSPLEHVATPWPENSQALVDDSYDTGGLGLGFETFGGTRLDVETNHLPRIGNLLGWRSLRTTVETELSEVTYE